MAAPKEEIKYSDGNDYSNLKPNCRDSDILEIHTGFKGCTYCGEDINVTILEEKDICHNCGYVYS